MAAASNTPTAFRSHVRDSQPEAYVPQQAPSSPSGEGAYDPLTMFTFADIEGQPIPDDQIDLLLPLRRVEWEQGRKEP